MLLMLHYTQLWILKNINYIYVVREFGKSICVIRLGISFIYWNWLSGRLGWGL